MRRKNSYLYVGKNIGKAKKIFLAALACTAMALAACGVQVGVTDDYISERNAAPKRTAPAPVYNPPPQVPQNNSWVGPANSATAQSGKSIVATARRQTGVPYRSGGTTPQKGFDCSGLIFWVYGQHGVSVPRLAKAQASYGRPVSSSSLQHGDIVAFRINGAYHTGIYSGNGKFIHSPSSGNRVREESLSTAYWRRSYVGARRFL